MAVAATVASPWSRSLDRVQQRAIKREAVLRAAAALFNQFGYHATSLAMVAELLGDSKRVAAELRDAQRAAEKARRAHAVTEDKARKDAERVAQVEADAALKKDQKAARDSKYAARKARQR